MANGTSGGKICVVCGDDCSTEPRTKDSAGRYYHRRCEAAAKQSRSAAAAAPPKVDDSVDLFADLDIEVPSASMPAPPEPTGHDAPTTIPCPSCQAAMRMNDAICMSCGYNTRSGSAIRTKKLKDKSPRSGPSVMEYAGTALGVFCITIFALIALYLVGIVLLGQTEAVTYIALAVFVILRIAIVLEAFTEDATTGLLTFIVPFYDFYYVYAVSENDIYKGMLPVATVAGIAGRIAMGV